MIIKEYLLPKKSNAKFKFHLYITSIPLYSILIFIVNTPIKQSQKSIVPNMDAATAAAAVNTTTFEPSFDLIQEDDCNTLLLYLPGFTKEQLRVQLTRNRVLKISGRRPLGNNRWSSFQKDFPVLESCDTNKITAKFEDGILYVRQPKEDKKLAAAAETQPPQKQAFQPHQEQAFQPKTAFQPPQKPEEVARPPLPPAKIDPPPPTPTKTPALTPDYKPEITAPRAPPTNPIHPIKDEIRSGERKSGWKEERGLAAEGSGGGDRKEKRKKGAGSSGGGAAKVEADNNTKVIAESPAARLKAARKKVMGVMVLLVVFALGIYVSKFPWFSKSDQN